MNHSGDAAEQIVRMSLEGVEVAARITGTAAKEIALLLLAALKPPANGNTKLKGKARLNAMLKSGKALEIFSVRERDLRTFVREAKRYGIVYCVLRNSKQTPDGLCDILVKADDAPKINRLVERFKFATVDKAKIESEIIQDMESQSAEPPDASMAYGQPGGQETNDIDELVDELMNDLFENDKGKAEPVVGQEGLDNPAAENVTQDMSNPAKTEKEKPAPKKNARGNKKDSPTADSEKETDPLASGGRNQSESPSPPKTNQFGHSSDNKKKSESPISSKPSVKKELQEITAAKKAKEAETLKRDDAPSPAKAKESVETTHKQPKNRRKSKSNKAR